MHVLVTYRQYRLLREEAERSGVSMCELIRRAIDTTFRPKERRTVKGYEVRIGLWRDPDAAMVGRLAHRPTP